MKDFRTYPSMIDSHCHLTEMEQKGVDPLFLLKEAEKRGMSYLLDAGIHLEDISRRLEWAEAFPLLFLGVGVHPSETEDRNPADLKVLQTYKSHPKVIAIGEIGIDLYHRQDDLPHQIEFFDAQLEIANSIEKPVIIHNRDADQPILERLRVTPPAQGGVIHCFSSDYTFASTCLDLGFYISFAGNVSYKKAINIRETARRIPIDRLLFETDAPYLAAQPIRGHLNSPLHTGYTVDCLAEQRGITPEALCLQVKENFIRCFHPQD